MSSSKVCYFAIINFIFLCMQTSAQNVVEDNRDSLLFITVESVQPTGTTIKETGTGFIIDEQGFVLTAAHLLTSDPNATVYGKRRSRNSPEAPMQLEFITFGCCDLALLKIPDQGVRWKPLRPATPAQLGNIQSNAPVIALGLGLKNDLAPAPGTLGNKGGNFVEGKSSGFWLFNSPVNYGNSGGPVFDGSGSIVIGIVKGGIPGAQGANYFIPITFATPLLQVAGLLPTAPDLFTLRPREEVWGEGFQEYKFGMTPDQINNLLPQPFGQVNWSALPIATEYKRDEVRYLWKYLTAFPNVRKFTEGNGCISQSSYIVFLFKNQKLFRISIRFLNDSACRNYEIILHQYANSIGASLELANSGNRFDYEDKRIHLFGKVFNNGAVIEFIKLGVADSDGNIWSPDI